MGTLPALVVAGFYMEHFRQTTPRTAQNTTVHCPFLHVGLPEADVSLSHMAYRKPTTQICTSMFHQIIQPQKMAILSTLIG